MTRRRGAVAVLALVVAYSVLTFVGPAALAAPHTATDHARSLWSLLALVPWAVVAGWGASVAIPYLSALLTRRPGHLAGVVTVVLSLADGFLATLAQQGDHLDARAALAASFGSWVIASKWHTKVLSGTATETSLHATGLTGPRRAPEHAAGQ